MNHLHRNQLRKQAIISSVVLVLLGFIAILPGSMMHAEDIEVKGSISADKIGTDDLLVYTVSIKGNNNPNQPDLSHFKDFRIAGTSRSSRFQFINGMSSYYTDFVYHLSPMKTGVFTLPPVTYSFNGHEYKTQPFKVEVVSGSVAPPASRQRQANPSPFDFDDDFFGSPFTRKAQPQQVDVRLITDVSKKKVAKGEPLILKILLYTRNRIQGINLVSNQSLPGFWQEWYPNERTIQGRTQILDGKSYQVYQIRKAVLFPTQTGTVKIPSLKFEMSLVDDLSFFQDTVQTISRNTPEVSVQVTDLPAQSAGLPVGRFSFQVVPDKTQIDINDLLTVKMRITGNGNIKTVNPPEFTPNSDFKVYPPKVTKDVTFEGEDYSGVLQSELPIAFSKAGVITLPALEFSYFDHSSSKVVSLKSQPMRITVTGVKEKTESASTIPATEIVKKGEDIDFIKKGEIYDQEENFYSKGWFFFFIFLPFMVNLAIIFKLRVYDKYIAESGLLKGRKLIQQTVRGLNAVKEPGEISPILENYLQKKTGIGLSELNSENIHRVLSKYGVPEDDIATLIRIKTESDSSRFSPLKSANSSDEELRKNVDRLIEILNRMDGRIK